MGILSFLKKRPDSPGDDGSNGDDGPLLDKVRRRHYVFAHETLRKTAYEDPLFILNILTSTKRDMFLEHVLEMTDKRLTPMDLDYKFSITDLSVRREWIGECPSVIIEMPTPRAVGEAYFVAIVLLASHHQGPDVVMDYFTLELGVTKSGEKRTTFCAWSEEDAHRSYGDGPVPTIEGFMGMIETKVKPKR